MEPEFSAAEAAAHLLEHRHLSVFDRAVFAGPLKLSLLVRAARQLLGDTPFLPSSQRPEQVFSGTMIERRDDSYWIHEKHEVSLMRYSDAASRRAHDLAEAVRAYVGSEMSIDGIEIDDDL